MESSSRRSFFRASGGLVGVALLPTVLLADQVRTPSNHRRPRLWKFAEILIGHSLSDQTPGPFISCPMFLPSGSFAEASHTLDLSQLSSGVVTSDVSGAVTRAIVRCKYKVASPSRFPMRIACLDCVAILVRG